MHQTWGKEIFDFFPPDCFLVGSSSMFQISRSRKKAKAFLTLFSLSKERSSPPCLSPIKRETGRGRMFFGSKKAKAVGRSKDLPIAFLREKVCFRFFAGESPYFVFWREHKEREIFGELEKERPFLEGLFFHFSGYLFFEKTFQKKSSKKK